jgi:putative membrane protein
VLRSLALVIHVIGVLLWIGGAAMASWTAAELALAPPEARRVGFGAARRALLVLATPGLLLAWIGGLVMLVEGWSAIYARAGWMHGKVTIGLVLAAVSGVMTSRIRKAAAGEREASRSLLAGLAMAFVLGAAIAVVLVVLRPGT